MTADRPEGFVFLKAALLALGTLTITATSAQSAFTTTLAAKNFAAVLAVSPNNAVALAKQGDLQFESVIQGKGNLVALNASARASITSEAINPIGLRQLAYSLGLGREIERARAEIDLSTRLSRRDFGTHFWLIQDAASKNDLRGALDQYDRALSTASESNQLLFPRLTEALNNQAIRHEFVRLIHKNSVWLANFLSFAIGNSTDPKQLAALSIEAGGMPVTVDYPKLDKDLFEALLAKRDYLEARDYYVSLKNADRGALTSVAVDSNAFTTRTEMVAWQLNEGSTVGASRMPGGGLSLFAASGENAVVAQKILFLPPGGHRLRIEFGAANLADHSGLQVQVVCLTKVAALKIWQSPFLMPRSQTNAGESFSLNDNCSAQQLLLQMAGGDGQSGSEIDVKTLQLD